MEPEKEGQPPYTPPQQYPGQPPQPVYNATPQQGQSSYNQPQQYPGLPSQPVYNAPYRPPPNYNPNAQPYSSPYQNQRPQPNERMYLMAVVPELPRTPCNISCPTCGRNVETRIEYKSGIATWGLCVCCVVVGCWLGCCLIPFCVNSVKDVNHICPSCGNLLGKRTII